MKLAERCAAALLLLALAVPLATAQPPSPDGSPVMDINTAEDFFAAWNNKSESHVKQEGQGWVCCQALRTCPLLAQRQHHVSGPG